MLQEDYDIQMQVDNLMQKVLESWKREGKWDGNNPNSPFYGFEKDPLLRILLSAFVYQTNGLKDEIQNFEKEVIGDFQTEVLPYQLTQAIPAFTMIKTAKNPTEKGDVFCDETSTFIIKKESLRVKEYFPFHPLFKTKILGMTVNGVTKIASDKWNVNIDVDDTDADLSCFGFMVNGLKYSDLNVYWNNEKLPLIKPWEFDRFPKTAWFADSNMAYNKSLLYGGDTQWNDLWSMLNVNFYMVAPTFHRPIDSDMINFVFEFSGMTKPFDFDMDNLFFNCLPALNVIKKDFTLSTSDPIVKLAPEPDFDQEEENNSVKNITSTLAENNHSDFFMNLIANSNASLEDMDRFTIRRFGAERFNVDALMTLSRTLHKRYESDFYAFQKIHKMQNADKIRRLDIVLKDIIGSISNTATPTSGIYAILKHGQNDAEMPAMKLSALFTDGAYSNDIDVFSEVMPPKNLDRKETRLLFKTFGGKDEVIDKDEKSMLAKYYVRTNDRIVTRADLKSFCFRYFSQNGYGDALLDVNSMIEKENGTALQHITLQLKNDFVRNREDIPMIIDRLKKLIEVRSANLIPIVVEYIAVV